MGQQLPKRALAFICCLALAAPANEGLPGIQTAAAHVLSSAVPLIWKRNPRCFTQGGLTDAIFGTLELCLN